MSQPKEVPKQTIHRLGEIPSETEIPRLAQEIHDLQAHVGGTITVRTVEFLAEQLRKGLVFFVRNAHGRVVNSFYLQSLDQQDASYRLSGVASEGTSDATWLMAHGSP